MIDWFRQWDLLASECVTQTVSYQAFYGKWPFCKRWWLLQM